MGIGLLFEEEHHCMSKQEKQEQTNQADEVEDLTVEVSAQQEVKGGNGDTQGLGKTYYIGSANGGVWK
jgi:hypothetical protein